MRWVGGLVALGLCGCTALNGEFNEQADTDRPSSGSAGSGSAASESTTGGRDSFPPGDGSGNDPSTSGEASTSGPGDSGTSSSTGSSGAETDGAPGEQVMLIYSAPAWSGSAAEGLDAVETATEHCLEHLPARCESEPLALLRSTKVELSSLFVKLGVMGTLPVYGSNGDGSLLIADSLLTMLASNLVHPLADAGVPTYGEESFWSGGLDKIPTNCNDWAAVKSVGAVGRFDLEKGWFDTEDVECVASLPILCVCASVPDPFGG